MEDFKRLSECVSVDSIGWRYDPVFLDEEHTVAWHISEFEKMARTLAGYTKTCVISFLDLYRKVERNFPEARNVPQKDRIAIGKELIRIAAQYGMTVRPCAEGTELTTYGADCSGCMTIQTFETALHASLDVPKKYQNLKNRNCGCMLTADIGAYDTCAHLCRYCYANSNLALVRENRKKHDPNSPFLIGHAMPGDVIHEAEQRSWIDRQLKLEW